MIHLNFKVANLFSLFLIRILGNDHTGPVFAVAGLLAGLLAVVVQVLRQLADLDDQHKPRY